MTRVIVSLSLLFLLAADAPRGVGEITLDSEPLGPLGLVVLGGRILPPQPIEFRAAYFRINVQGTGGNTNVILQISDGVNTCNCPFPCDAPPGNKRISCNPIAGTGCMFAPGADVTYSWAAVGNCAVKPGIVGNLALGGIWQ